MSKTPFMPLWVSDFLGDTLDLDATEIGAYLLLLMAQWQRDGRSLPSDLEKLRRVARCERNWPKVWAAIGHYFTQDEAGFYSKRLRLEAENVAAKRNVNARNGALGGNAKALKTLETGLADASETPERNAGIPEPELEREKRETVVSPKKVAARAARLPDDWRLPKAWGEWAVKEGLSPDVVRREADKFHDYWRAKAGKDAAKLDWEATWRNWMRKRIDDLPKQPQKGGIHTDFWTGPLL